MIEAYKYFPGQMNGPVISSLGQAVESELELLDTIIAYLGNMTINNALEGQLEFIGMLIGFPRPLVPIGFNDENVFVFGTVPVITDWEIGFGAAGQSVGGKFTSVQTETGGYMNLGLYRSLLKGIAILKRYGVTLAAIDEIARVFDTNYTITFDEDEDIVITYGNSIGYQNIWLITKIFYKIATIPQVLVISGEEDEEEEE